MFLAGWFGGAVLGFVLTCAVVGVRLHRKGVSFEPLKPWWTAKRRARMQDSREVPLPAQYWMFRDEEE